ncbi:hypothetical protein [Jiangella mangrovi]|uniref:Uncharacterized protein n=1 Tax=Jiangella mangrovi TaxID=1524084 RepID=A0A7W9GX42_9ACTN|nr:hypothetical protein [Jiangella mangrovi]MBB5791386.1 hypothetical protein [Jiangella mangrovi]
MSPRELRELFEDALAGEPEREVPVRDDVDRGRRSLRRRRRRWTAGGALVAAVSAAVLVLPASPLSLVDGDPADLDEVIRDEAVAGPDGGVDALEQEMWQAVEAVLPGDVGPAADFAPGGDGPGPDLSLRLERRGAPFTVRVWLQEARTDPEAFRPCSRPGTALEVTGGWQDCQEGADSDGRWRISADVDQNDHITVLEGDGAAVTVVRPAGTGVTLTQDETDAVADAVWQVGRDRPAEQLRTAIDMDAAASEATVDDVVAVLQERLGLGTFGFRTSGLTHSALSELGPDSASVWGRYVTTSGVGVDVVLWQKDRVYEPLCISAVDGCLAHPGSVVYFGNELAGRYDGPSLLLPAGPRGGLWLHLGSTDPELGQRFEAAGAEAAGRIRFAGDDPYPLP